MVMVKMQLRKQLTLKEARDKQTVQMTPMCLILIPKCSLH